MRYHSSAEFLSFLNMLTQFIDREIIDSPTIESVEELQRLIEAKRRQLENELQEGKVDIFSLIEASRRRTSGQN